MSTRSDAIDVSVIVVNYNGRPWLEGCLTATLAQLTGQHELIVVDNASSDDSLEFLRACFPAVRVLALDRNSGFAEGNNIGARVARGRYIAFLNNDTIPQPGWLIGLRAPFDRDPSTAVTTSRILYLHDPSVVDSAGDGYLRAGGAFKRLHGAPSASAEQPGEAFGACGAACMFRKDVFLDLGGFDEDFFMVYEDVDISYRARLRGYRCMYAPNAIVHHAGSGTLHRNSPLSVYYGQRNLEWTYLKNTPWPLLVRTFPSHVLYGCAALSAYGARGLLRPYLQAKWAAVKGLPAILRKRSKVQSGRLVSTRDLWQAMDGNWIGRKRAEKQFDFRP